MFVSINYFYIMNNQLSSKNTYQKIALYLIGFYIAYNVYLRPIGFFVPRLSFVTLILAGAFTLFSTKITLSLEFRCLALFILYAFTSGLLVAIDTGLVMGKTRVLVESFVAGTIVFTIANDEDDLRKIIGMFAIGAIIVGVYSFFSMDYLYSDKGRLSLDEDFNANTFGVMLMYGVWSIIFTLYNEKKSFVRIVIIVFLSLLLLYAIVQTGSRKSSIGSILVLVSYVVYIFLGRGKSSKWFSKTIIVPLFIALIVFVYFRYIDAFLEKSETLMNRMDNMSLDGAGRWGLIKDSFRVWSEYPLFGVGLDNNRYYTFAKLYSHNSYAEIFACTGIIGVALFFPIFWRMLVFVTNGIKKIRNTLASSSKFFMIILILVYLGVCFTQINIYNRTHMFITYFILTFISINTKNNEKNIRFVV